MKKNNEFLLPNDLGWQCNDDLQKCIDDWVNDCLKHKDGFSELFFKVAKAELIDDMYAIIKRYQGIDLKPFNKELKKTMRKWNHVSDIDL